MANINQAQIDALTKEINAKWTDAFTAAPQEQLNDLATFYTSNSAEGAYIFMQALGGWRRWSGARVFKDIASNKYQLKNLDYEMSISMDANDIKDDRAGLYMDIVPQMVRDYFKLRTELIFDILTSNPTAYDDVALFSTAGRNYGGNVIDNFGTAALDATAFEAAYVKMMSYKDHAGKPLVVRPTTLVVGPSNAKTASDILGNLYIGDGETSATQIQNYYNSLGVRAVVSPYLIGDYANYWYLADTADVVKGVILQIREIPSPVLSNAQEITRSKTIDYMADARLAAAPGAPHKIYCSTGAA